MLHLRVSRLPESGREAGVGSDHSVEWIHPVPGVHGATIPISEGEGKDPLVERQGYPGAVRVDHVADELSCAGDREAELLECRGRVVSRQRHRVVDPTFHDLNGVHDPEQDAGRRSGSVEECHDASAWCVVVDGGDPRDSTEPLGA